MEIWLSDKKTGIECGLNNDGFLFLGDSESGSILSDTKDNRKKVINDFCKSTGRVFSPIISACGKPIDFDGTIVEFSK